MQRGYYSLGHVPPPPTSTSDIEASATPLQLSRLPPPPPLPTSDSQSSSGLLPSISESIPTSSMVVAVAAAAAAAAELPSALSPLSSGVLPPPPPLMVPQTPGAGSAFEGGHQHGQILQPYPYSGYLYRYGLHHHHQQQQQQRSNGSLESEGGPVQAPPPVLSSTWRSEKLPTREKPRHPLTAYTFFNMERRMALRGEYKQTGKTGDLAKAVGAAWKAMV